MITLPIKRKWFDMIASGEKLEEYRAMTPRYATMFRNASDAHDCFWCILRNGYSLTSPAIKLYVKLCVGTGNPNWGAEPDKTYFVLRILKKERCRSDA